MSKAINVNALENNSAKVLQVEIRLAYGRTFIYPCNDTAGVFAKLLNVKCFNKSQLALIRLLGFTVEVKQPTLEL